MSDNLRVAHVGYTESDDDFERLRDAENSVEFYAKSEEFLDFYEDADFIDLSNGRDFLTENGTYDIVILHRIWYGKDMSIYNSIVGASPLQSRQKWVQRLIDTQASFIVVYGGTGTEIDETILGNIPGYRIVHSKIHGDVMNAPKSIYQKL